MAGRGLRWLFAGLLRLPGLIQLLVCLVLWAIGFEFEDLKSWVMFLYVFHSIMLGHTAFFPHDYDEFAQNGHWLIVSLNDVVEFILQIWSSVFVSIFVYKWQFNDKSCEKPHTIPIPALVVLIIEWIFCVITFVKICRQWVARLSKQPVSKYSLEKKYQPVQAEDSGDKSDEPTDEDNDETDS